MIRGVTEGFGSLVRVISNRRRKFKLLELQGDPPPSLLLEVQILKFEFYLKTHERFSNLISNFFNTLGHFFTKHFNLNKIHDCTLDDKNWMIKCLWMFMIVMSLKKDCLINYSLL